VTRLRDNGEGLRSTPHVSRYTSPGGAKMVSLRADDYGKLEAERDRYREALLLLMETGGGGYVVITPEEDEIVKATLREVNRG
jgi:hypothetical protein